MSKKIEKILSTAFYAVLKKAYYKATNVRSYLWTKQVHTGYMEDRLRYRRTELLFDFSIDRVINQ